MAGRFSIEAVFKAVDKVTAPVSRMQNRIGKMTRGMARGLRSANRVLDKFTRGLKTAGKASIVVAATGIGVLVTAVGFLAREFSKVEDAEAAFTPLLGGVKRAKELVQELNDTAASTPFQFETLAAAANQLLPVMDGNIENTIKTLRTLGDTAGGNAQKLDSITRGFTKAMLKGKVDMESLNMIAEAGVPIFGDLAEVMGTEVGEQFFKTISAGKVTTDQLTKAFEKMTSKGGKFFKGMEIASKTQSGLWSTLKDNFSLTAATLGGILAPTIKDIIKSLTQVAIKVRAWVTENKELISGKFNEALRFLIDNFQTIVLWAKRVGIALGVFLAFAVVLKSLIGILTLVNLVMAANPIVLIALGVVALIAGIVALVTWIDTVVESFDALPAAIQAILLPFGLLLKGIKFIKDNIGVLGKVAKFLGFTSSDDEGDETTPRDSAGAAMVSPQDRTARSIEERRQTSTSEITLTAGKGTQAEVTQGSLGQGIFIENSGDF